MCEPITKEECKAQLEELGVQYKKLPLTITKHICNATTEIYGKIFKVSMVERIGYGVQIRTEGNEKSCLVTYEAMLNIAEAMGLFDEDKE
ncbi:hypothetical protein B0186_11215 [Canicola haemoglobinophilus]|uniref:Uncharacterized protein n=1 Tax=Canicola haemoglobinophilus TaxID=733 RepID=A0A1V4AYC1_9PAST|nr:hypothetical protein [Canicola haemoglobinophilus]OOR95813.1 hypothetical protein B0186_11215 [Canicola haemoglobinophilus]STO59545.1 Uncharacterised protein [Canicola haemoglobinophilus]